MTLTVVPSVSLFPVQSDALCGCLALLSLFALGAGVCGGCFPPQPKVGQLAGAWRTLAASWWAV